MKKIEIKSIPFILGSVNWIIVIIMLTIIFVEIKVNPKVTPKGMYPIMEVIGFYLKYSFLPALISLPLTVISKKGYKALNLAINSLFLILYSLIYLFFRFIAMSA